MCMQKEEHVRCRAQSSGAYSIHAGGSESGLPGQGDWLCTPEIFKRCFLTFMVLDLLESNYTAACQGLKIPFSFFPP